MYRSALDPHWLSPHRAPPVSQEDANNNNTSPTADSKLLTSCHSNEDSKLLSSGCHSNEDHGLLLNSEDTSVLLSSVSPSNDEQSVSGCGSNETSVLGCRTNEDDTSAPRVKSMKYTGGDSDIMGMPMDTLLYTWSDEPFLTDGNNKQILIGGVMDDDDDDQKPTLEEIESMLLTSNGSEENNNLAELKPLPPFTGKLET